MDSTTVSFRDRMTMRFDRVFPHPIERVFAAVSTAEHLDRWLLGRNHVDPRPGGAFGMTFGSNDAPFTEGTIAAFDPPRVIEYRFDGGAGALRFELESVDGGTAVTFLHVAGPGPYTGGDPGEGWDLPAGPDTPWTPNVTAGWMGLLDNLASLLDDTPILGNIGNNAEARRIWKTRLPAVRQLIAETLPKV